MENPDLKTIFPKEHPKSQSLAHSVRYALMGISRTLLTQRNMKLHVLAALGVALLGVIFPFDPLSRAIILLCMALVIFSEVLNTAMEAIVDLYTGETHRLAQIAKDAAAGGVMILSICSSLIFLGVLEAHQEEIERLPMLFEKLAFIGGIVVLQALCLFGLQSSFLRLLTQGAAFFGIVLLSFTSHQPIFSAVAFLLVALSSFAPFALNNETESLKD